MSETPPQGDIADLTVLGFAVGGVLVSVALGAQRDTTVLPIRIGKNAATMFCSFEARVQA